ncbi:MAG TPA: efflux RND transporter periplasmic adaptor subunit, partial [Geobacteraceae bacterium]
AAQGVARAEARLSQVREGAKAAATVAGYTRITAPLSGIVTSKKAEFGMTVFPGMPLVTVEEEGSYRLELDAPESLVGKVRPGESARIMIEGMPPGEGRITEVVPSVDPSSRTFTVKVDLKGKGFRSGMYGRAQVPVGTVQGLFVPKGAVMERGSLTSVWAVDKENVARLRLVKTGRSVGDRVEILAGLSPGERIVTAGGEKVSDGAKIE